MQVLNPATDELITTLTEDSSQTLLMKFQHLQQAQKKWALVALQERIQILKKFSALLLENIEQLAVVLTSEVGKPLQQSRNEINGGVNRIQWLTDNGEKFLSDEIMTQGENLKERISYEPLGVVCNISAWNYPYLVGINVFIPALMAGNSVLYKPSEYASLTGLEIEKLLKAAGVPDDVFQVALGARSVGEILLDLPFDGYYFTGSYKTGSYIYQRVAPKMVPCQLELGGKDPVYITNDIQDIASIAASTADGAFYNNGQSCCSVERIYVHKDVYDTYVNEFIKEVKSYKLGNPLHEGIYLGALTRKEQLFLLEDQVQDAVNRGATLRTGGKRISEKGNFFEPTVLTDVDNAMRVMREESFGPIIGIMKVEDDEHAVALMNDTEYGLTSAVYCQSEERAEKILARLNSGSAYWNCCDRVSAALPWSGRKNSGFGSTLSHAGIRTFAKVKAYHLRRS
jgi:acyl-CoA reductase-like NAD-dependent aldehyde dehydrogenase